MWVKPVEVEVHRYRTQHIHTQTLTNKHTQTHKHANTQHNPQTRNSQHTPHTTHHSHSKHNHSHNTNLLQEGRLGEVGEMEVEIRYVSISLLFYFSLSLAFYLKIHKTKRGGAIYLGSPPHLNFFDFFSIFYSPNPPISFQHFVIGGNEWHHSNERVPLPPVQVRVGPTR
jgi:hypothetical protein